MYDELDSDIENDVVWVRKTLNTPFYNVNCMFDYPSSWFLTEKLCSTILLIHSQINDKSKSAT